ncbi:MAG: pentapeptide repeat-containing protein [Gammaproteobacteria bacterium]
MANPRHLAILREGLSNWNQWRAQSPEDDPDPDDVLDPRYLEEAALGNPYLSRADLSGADLSRTMLRGGNFQRAILTSANLRGADLVRADLYGADLRKTDLREAHVWSADLREADLSGADLQGAMLRGARLAGADLRDSDLRGADMSYADLRDADLSGAQMNGADISISTLVRTTFEKTDLTGCCVYGVSVWDVRLKGAIQSDLLITPAELPAITVDHLEVAQFLYLVLNNERIRDVIDTITSKVVLILGRFTPERKAVLDEIRSRLRKRNYVPVLFDFDKPVSKDTHETITTLARMARFVIADITDAHSIPQELVSIVEQLPSLPIQPILEQGSKPWGMFDHIRRYPWVLDVQDYAASKKLSSDLYRRIIAPAEKWLKEESARSHLATRR